MKIEYQLLTDSSNLFSDTIPGRGQFYSHGLRNAIAKRSAITQSNHAVAYGPELVFMGNQALRTRLSFVVANYGAGDTVDSRFARQESFRLCPMD